MILATVYAIIFTYITLMVIIFDGPLYIYIGSLNIVQCRCSVPLYNVVAVGAA